ncbi:hypothetical protein Terro_1136 [Terriglobus roseus DSM 18391]|uniref:Uncharacterized protein n=1 Tax=Terriglobus roseus (strain DSM 18391 / NRRL B-41598 / KBS 63) TaxID=926566 RepID=I3ZDY6_TERRK|nr:hypothetical protein [Terriglobus roseus]AFL87454.1 hypothetical protein Terro_1136 [Terriglobus roseus DSM 18391]
MSINPIKPIAHHDLKALSLTRLEALYAHYSKDERNVSLKHRRRNFDAMHTITAAIRDRSAASKDELFQLRHAFAIIRLIKRTITCVNQYGPARVTRYRKAA